jgi:hypothetical protein
MTISVSDVAPFVRLTLVEGPKRTEVVMYAPLLNPEPWITIAVPPAFDPLEGETDVMLMGCLLQSMVWTSGGYVVAVTSVNPVPIAPELRYDPS